MTRNLVIADRLYYERANQYDIYVHVPEMMTGQATEIMVKELNLGLSLPSERQRAN
jgi:hypothetical protein